MTRQAAQKCMVSPESKVVNESGSRTTLPAIPIMAVDELSGVPDNQNLPDLVINRRDTDNSMTLTVIKPTQAAEAASTEEEIDAATTLLSLGEIHDDTLEEDNENAQLMPIGGQNAPMDAAPEPIRLDQVSVDNAITGMIQTEELQKKDELNAQLNQATNTEKTVDENAENKTEPPIVTEEEPTVKGALKTKTYTLKKKADSK